MRTRIFHLSCSIAASLLSGLLLVLAFPNHNIGWLAWIGLVPLLLAIQGRRPIWAFLLSLMTGVIFFSGICSWILESPGYHVLHHILAGLFLGAPFGFFGLVFALICRRRGGGLALFAAPFTWVCIEYVRSNLSFLSLPLGLLAHTQYLHPALTQFVCFTGAYGLSFMIVMVNSALVAVVLTFFPRSEQYTDYRQFAPSKRTAAFLICVTGILSSLALLYSQRVLSEPIEGKNFKISLIQGNIDQALKWNPKYAKSIMQTYADLTKKAVEDQPALIVWPEAATPRAINMDRRLYSELRQIVEETGIPLLLGSTMHQKFKKQELKAMRFKNSAFLISPDKAESNQKYDKILLVPFGEYVPMEKLIPWSWIKVPEVANYLPGKEWTVFDGPGFRFSVTICWESIFPGLVRKFVNKGAQFIVNITNESWYKDTAAPHQFVAASVFRALENRVYVVRCANTGVSCFIDPYGRIVDRVKDEKGRDTYVQGVLTKTIVPSNSKTFYTLYGDWLVWTSFAWLAIVLIYAFAVRSGGGEARTRNL
jgi:apolipoprotein N-acyltransferase